MGSSAAMSEDLGPSDSDCILYLEQTIDDLKSQGDVTKQLLQDILGQLGPTAPIGPAPMQKLASSNQQIETPVVTTTTPSARWKKNHVKPSTPADFDGDQAKGKAFLTSCHTYIWLCADSFKDNDTKIIWAMSFMKTGRASRWAQRELEHEAAKGSLWFTDWLDFEDEFHQDFTPLNAKATAVNIHQENTF